MSWPGYWSSFASRRSNRVKASAVAPAKSPITSPLASLRTFFALPLTMVCPIEICPSPPMTVPQGAGGWTIDPEQLDDRHIVRRMVLKRRIYGVDKNLMAVELAKVSLWLHTFTVGAPLSFLDHHLRHGDSLFGSWVRGGIDKATALGAPLLLHAPMTQALRAASKMQIIEGLTDAEIAEAHRSKDVFDEV